MADCVDGFSRSFDPVTMSRARVFLLAGISAVVLLAVPLSIHYEEVHLVHAVHPRNIGDLASRQRVLIATQGTVFKDELVAAIIAYLRAKGVSIREIDVSGLPRERAAEWSAVIVLHGWQFGRAPAEVREFVTQVPDKRRLIVITTSGNGHAVLPGVDAISAASVDRDVPSRLAEITPRLDVLLAPTGR